MKRLLRKGKDIMTLQTEYIRYAAEDNMNNTLGEQRDAEKGILRLVRPLWSSVREAKERFCWDLF